MNGFRKVVRAAAFPVALAVAVPGAALADQEPDVQTKKTMQEWTTADAGCRTTLAQDACQRRDETWNWLFSRGWRRDAGGQWFRHKDLMSPAPSYARP